MFDQLFQKSPFFQIARALLYRLHSVSGEWEQKWAKKSLGKKTKTSQICGLFFKVIFDLPQTPSRPGNGGPAAAIDVLSIATSLGVIGQGVKKKVEIFENGHKF